MTMSQHERFARQGGYGGGNSGGGSSGGGAGGYGGGSDKRAPAAPKCSCSPGASSKCPAGPPGSKGEPGVDGLNGIDGKGINLSL